MPTAENAKIQYEAGQTLVTYALLTDSGDHQYFTPADTILSGKSGYEPVCRPNGLITGGVVSVGTGNDNVQATAATCYLAGVLTSVSADTSLAVSRGADTDVCRITSIIITNAGAYDVAPGTDGTALSETRGAAGGPPLIAVDAIEVAQVRVSSISAAAVTAAEIFQVVGQHKERYDYPAFTVDPIGLGLAATNAVDDNAHVKFAAALPESHTGPVAKRVYMQYYTPTMADVPKSMDFKPVENTHSITSTQYYGGTVGSSSSSIGQGGFTVLLETGVNDDFLKQCRDETITIKHFPDRLKSQYSLTQGKIGITTTFPASNQIQGAVTISAENPTAFFEG